MMRNVESHLIGEKIDDAVTHYINTHQSTESVHVDTNSLSLNIHDDGGGRVVTVMHPQNYPQQVCRQISVGEQMGDGPWVEELLDGRLAALVAHLAQPSRPSHHHGQNSHHKIPTSVRSDVDTSVILEGPMRLFSGHSLDQHQETLAVQVSDLPLPPLQDMKRCSDTGWFSKNKNSLKEDGEMLPEDSQVLEMASASPAQNKQSKKSLPHKKRISRKLKRNTGNTTPSQQDIVVIQCGEEVQHEQEEILPDSFVEALPRHAGPAHLPDAHVPHVRPVLVCQLCGQFYGEEQLKFYQHLRHHYEPPTTIVMENPVVPDIGIDKMTNTCIVDNGATLPDSIVELSLENTVPKTMYQTIDKQFYKYSMGMDKEVDGELDDSLDKLELYCCGKCNRSFRKQKQCEAHIREGHAISKLEDMGEFSEPEDLMEGIHVAVDEGEHDHEQHGPEHAHQQHDHEQHDHERYDAVLPHLTIDNGHVHQEHVRHWYSRSDSESPEVAPLCACGGAGCCPVCAPPYPPAPPPPPPAPPTPPPPPPAHPPRPQQVVTREEVLHKILENEAQAPGAPPGQEPPEAPEAPAASPKKRKEKGARRFECVLCGRVFEHRNSMVYHLLMHSERKHSCAECGKRFYTATSLKLHKRTHDGAKPCECEECGQRFRRSGDLKYHKASKHSTEKLFKCEFCLKEFARRYSLSVHRRIHTGERNYKCDFCPMTFRAASYRQMHMRTHTGMKPYKCPHCDKCFRVSYDMRRHVRVVHEKQNKKDDDPKKPKGKATKKDDKGQKNKEDKKKVAKKPPNVTIQNKGFKFGEIEMLKETYYITEYDETLTIKHEKEFKYKNQMADEKLEYRENTDGKMPVFSQVAKNTSNPVTQSDIKNLETNRDRELHGDIEMFDKLAFYNVPAE